MRNEIPGARYRPMDLRITDKAITMENATIAVRDPSTTDSEWGVLIDLINEIDEPLRTKVFKRYHHTAL